MKKLLKYLCVMEGIFALPALSYANEIIMKNNKIIIKETKVEDDIHYDNYYVDYVYNNYLKNKKKQTYTIETVYDIQEMDIDNEYADVPATDDLMSTNIVSTEVTEIDTDDANDNETEVSEIKTEISEIKDDTEKSEPDKYRFYIGFGLGISNLQDYNSKRIMDNESATMKPDISSNVYANFGIHDFFYDNMHLEFELGYAENKKIPTPHENGETLIDYNQGLKTYNLGANLVYNIADFNSLFIPYIAFGCGMARLELSDFGITSGNVSSTMFESKSEAKNAFYGKIAAGVMYRMRENSKFTVGGEYILYKDVEYKYLELSDLARINFTAGLKFYF